MPLPIIHMLVANKIAIQGRFISDFSGYLLASVAPDAIHMRQGNQKKSKRKTHISSVYVSRTFVSKKRCIRNLTRFYLENNGKVDEDFLLGYIVHILTDMYWIKNIGKYFLLNYLHKSGLNFDMRTSYYSDLTKVDYSLFKSEFENAIWYKFKSSNMIGLNELLSFRDLELWKDKIIKTYESIDGNLIDNPLYISIEDVKLFIELYSSNITEDLRHIISVKLIVDSL